MATLLYMIMMVIFYLINNIKLFLKYPMEQDGLKEVLKSMDGIIYSVQNQGLLSVMGNQDRAVRFRCIPIRISRMTRLIRSIPIPPASAAV